MRKTKASVGLLVILCMVMGLIPAIYAQVPSYVKLKGIYETFQNLSFETDGDVTSIEWLQSDTQAGTYSVISGETKNTFYTGGAADGTAASPYAGKWIKVRINGSVESEPRQIGPALGRQEDITGTNAIVFTGTDTTYSVADISPAVSDVMYAFPNGAKSDTPADYVFTVDGMDFILLDDTESDESRFLVLTKTTFGSKIFDTAGGQLFDPTKNTNIAYWLNDSTNSGYFGGGTDGNGNNKLPASILSHVNKNQTWKIERMMWADNHAYHYERAATCGIVLPALYELKKYYEKIGFNDNTSIGWWTRTPQGMPRGDGNAVLATSTGGSNIGKFFGKISSSAGNSAAVRPMFCLNKDFFKDKVIDLTKTGSGARQIIRANYTADQLVNAGYDAAVVKALYDEPIPTPTPIGGGPKEPNLPSGNVNISLNKPATSSSIENDDETPGKACDSDTTVSRWAGLNQLTGKNSDWWMVDLGESATLSRTDIHWFNSGTKRAYKYYIEASMDGSTFTKIADRQDNTIQDNTTDSFNTGTRGRYVKITIVGETTNSGLCKASIFDVSVYGQFDTAVSSPVINYWDSNNIYTTVFASAYSIKADAIIANYLSDDCFNAALILALYDNNGVMKDIECTYGSVNKTQQQKLSAALTYSKPKPQGYYAKAYIWNNLNGMNPYSDPFLSPGTTEYTQTSPGNSTNPSISTDGGIITIKGKASTNEKVTLEVFKPNKTISDIGTASTSQEIKAVISHLYQATADANGYYTFRFTMEKSGTYSARLCGEYFVLDPIQFSYISNQDVAEGIAAFNTNEGSNDLNRMREKVEQYKVPLELDFTLYNEVVNKDAVYQKLISGRSSQGYRTKQQIIDTFNAAVMVQAAKEAADVQEMSSVLNEYYVPLMSETDKYSGIYKDMSSMTSTFKSSVARAFIELKKSTVFDSVPEMAIPFNKAVAIGTFNSADSWGVIDSAIADPVENMNDVLLMSNTDLAAYNQLPQKNKANICKDLIGNSFTSTEAINQKFAGLLAAEIEAVKDEERQGGSKGSSSGSGKTTSTIKLSSGVAIDKLPIVQPKKFADLAGFDWAEESIDSLASRGVIDGQGNNLFKPEEKVTREQFLKMLISGFKIVNEAATSQFSDISTDGWYYKYVATAEKLGLTHGMGDGSFGLGSEISRQEMAVMAYRVASYVNVELKAVDSPQLFDDNEQIDDYAKEAVSKMQQAKVIMGVDGNVFEPETTANRAQAAVIIYRLLQLKDAQ